MPVWTHPKGRLKVLRSRRCFHRCPATLRTKPKKSSQVDGGSSQLGCNCCPSPPSSPACFLGKPAAYYLDLDPSFTASFEVIYSSEYKKALLLISDNRGRSQKTEHSGQQSLIVSCGESASVARPHGFKTQSTADAQSRMPTTYSSCTCCVAQRCPQELEHWRDLQLYVVDPQRDIS